MDIVLNRKAGVPIPEQIAAQIDLKILSGELLAGARLPSVRALARRLRVHPNTASAAYRLLEEQSRLEVLRGSGVFVRRPGPRQVREARDLDEMIRLGLHVALERYSGAEVRAAVLRWLSGAPPARIVAIDPAQEIGELLARELSDALGIPTSACSLAELKRHPDRLWGALGVTLPPKGWNRSPAAPVVV
jgi:DNA-binding transcriptional regulator YhcF (GntR family)